MNRPGGTTLYIVPLAHNAICGSFPAKKKDGRAGEALQIAGGRGR